MRPGRWTALGLLALTACAPAPRFETYEDPAGDYRLERPKDWRPMGNSNRGAKPVSAVMFIGKTVQEENGIPVGASLTVSKLYRLRKDYPGKDAAYERYRKDALVPASVLFGAPASLLPESARKLLPKDIRDISVSGQPAKTYRHPSTIASLAMIVEDVVIQTPEAYFVVEYRATPELFEEHHYAFDRAKESFSLRR